MLVHQRRTTSLTDVSSLWSHSCNSLHNGKNLKVSGPTTLVPKLVPTSPDNWSPRPKMLWVTFSWDSTAEQPCWPCPLVSAIIFTSQQLLCLAIILPLWAHTQQAKSASLEYLKTAMSDFSLLFF